MVKSRSVLVSMGVLAAAALAIGSHATAARATTYAIQFGPSGGAPSYEGSPAYNGSLFNGDVNVTPASGGFLTGTGSDFAQPAGLAYTLGSYSLAFTSGYGLYTSLGDNPGNPSPYASTSVNTLNASYFYASTGAGSTSPVDLTLSGLNAGQTVNFQFLGSVYPANQATVTIENASGTAISNPSNNIAINSNTGFLDAGTYTGQTSYLISVAPSAGNAEGDIASALITISPVPEPASVALVGVGALGLLLLKRRRSA